MKIISLYSIKGGVGKTVAAVNLSYFSALEQIPTLLIDLDPQGATSFYLKVRPSQKFSAKKMVHRGQTLVDSIKATDYECFDILPADLSLRKLDIVLDDQKKSKKQLTHILKGLSGDYERIFIDCPPGLNLVAENIFIASDLLLIPFIPSTLSSLTYQQLFDFFNKNDYRDDRIFPFFSMVDNRRSLHKKTIDDFRDDPHFVFENVIPYSSIIEEMGIHRKPVYEYSKKSKAALSYKNLWEEIKMKVFN